jgi:hypothetical protein
MVDPLDPPVLGYDIWPDTGVEPVQLSDAVYTGGEQPIAEYDNYYQHELSEATHTNRDLVLNHRQRHSAGGPDELDLDGLSVGTSLTLAQVQTNVAGLYPGPDTTDRPLFKFDSNNNIIEDISPIRAEVIVRGGISLENEGLDLGDTNLSGGGDVLYDSDLGVIKQNQLGGPASELSSYPVPSADLESNTVTIDAEGRLTGGGEVSLGGSVSIGMDGQPFARKSEMKKNWHDTSEGGLVLTGDVGYIGVHELSPGETIKIWQATLIGNDLGPVPDGIDLVLGRGDPTDDGGTQSLTLESTILSGDGTTRYEEVSGGNVPIASYQNNSAASVGVFIGVDNGDSEINLGGSGAKREVQAGYIAKTES